METLFLYLNKSQAPRLVNIWRLFVEFLEVCMDAERWVQPAPVPTGSNVLVIMIVSGSTTFQIKVKAEYSDGAVCIYQMPTWADTDMPDNEHQELNAADGLWRSNIALPIATLKDGRWHFKGNEARRVFSRVTKMAGNDFKEMIKSARRGNRLVL